MSALEDSVNKGDADSARKHFLSAMKLFAEISRQLTTSDAMAQTDTEKY